MGIGMHMLATHSFNYFMILLAKTVAFNRRTKILHIT